MIICSYGGGTNSTALIIEAINRGFHINHILFADTGSEMPHTMAFLEEFKVWLSLRGHTLTTVKWVRFQGPEKGKFITLEEQCLRFEEMPSKAYGYSGCTYKWKQQPIERYIKYNIKTDKEEKPTRWIGYDAGEPERVLRMKNKKANDPLFKWEAPLFDWGMERDDCVRVIQEAGLSLPGKSSCFFCPSMKKNEIDDLKARYPKLLERALRIEDLGRANLTSQQLKGLGRNFSWREYLEGKEVGCEVVESECGCHDDSEDRE